LIPCYVGGRGMFATETTHRFKTAVMAHLEQSGLGYDTRYRYYRERFPDMAAGALAEMVCDPVEFYDPDWPAYLAEHRGSRDDVQVLTEFMLLRDGAFRAAARAAIMCYDEAGFGSGVNSMRFISAGKPILGFYRRDALARGVNLASVLQLELEYPETVRLLPYATLDDIITRLTPWLRALSDTPNRSK
jgi:hypothetical protein